MTAPDEPKPALVCAVCRKVLGAGTEHFVYRDRATCIDCCEAERRVRPRPDEEPKEPDA